MEKEITAQTNVTQIAEGNKGANEIQSDAQNKEFARMRRNQEREEREKKIAEDIAVKTAKEILGVNPYTGKEFTSFDDYKDYLDKKTKVNDKTENKSDSEENLKTENSENNQNFEKNSENDGENDIFQKKEDFSDDALPDDNWFKNDLKSFLSQNPEFDGNKLYNLLSDENFSEFANEKIGKRPLDEIYKDYNFLLKKVEILSEEKAKKMYLKRFSSPGSLMGTPDFNGQKMWSSMTDNEFENAIKNAKNGMYKNI